MLGEHALPRSVRSGVVGPCDDEITVVQCRHRRVALGRDPLIVDPELFHDRGAIRRDDRRKDTRTAQVRNGIGPGHDDVAAGQNRDLGIALGTARRSIDLEFAANGGCVCIEPLRKYAIVVAIGRSS